MRSFFFLLCTVATKSKPHPTTTAVKSLTFGNAAQEVFMSQFRGALSQSNHTCLNTDGLQLGAVKFVRTPRKLFKVHIVVHCHLSGMDLENSSPCGFVWKREFDFPIQTAGSQKSRIKNIDTVCCSNDLR
jgi:hypothetical protein